MNRRLLSLGVLGAVLVAAGCAATESPTATSGSLLASSELCQRVQLATVTSILGPGWQAADDTSGRCRYQSVRQRSATITIASTALTADAWRRQVTQSGGVVTERDGTLVADYGGDGFGPLDEIWWTDGSSSLVLRADAGLTLDQAVAIVSSARQGPPTTSIELGGGTTVLAPPLPAPPTSAPDPAAPSTPAPTAPAAAPPAGG